MDYLARRAAPLLLFLAAAICFAQQDAPRQIQDNSFLIEEAYNQEAGVVQHISAFSRLWESRDWAYSFTQEWPVPGHARHQLSYTLVVTDPGATSSGAGMGDAYMNYRYQLVGSGEARLAIAPRVSLITPTGNSRLGRGVGGYGLQMSLPLSYALTKQFVLHTNAGVTLVPKAANTIGQRAFTKSLNAGQSIVWLARPRFNVLLEAIWNGTDAVSATDRTARTNTVLLNPGIRWAYRFRNGLEIVPGVGVPVGVGPSAGERGIFLYLSFEHPLWHESENKN